MKNSYSELFKPILIVAESCPMLYFMVFVGLFVWFGLVFDYFIVQSKLFSRLKKKKRLSQVIIHLKHIRLKKTEAKRKRTKEI